MIKATLKAQHYNVTHAAHSLDMKRTTLVEKIKKYSIKKR